MPGDKVIIFWIFLALVGFAFGGLAGAAGLAACGVGIWLVIGVISKIFGK